MNGYGCQVRNLRSEALSGFRTEKNALLADGYYLTPDATGWVDASGLSGLCVICENCGSVVEEVPEDAILRCPDCGESIFRVIQGLHLVTISGGFAVRWFKRDSLIEITVPRSACKDLVSIRYTVDGRDPTPSSLVYKTPIPYRNSYKPIRAAVFYEGARSQIIEWDYGRAEMNRERIRVQSEARNQTKKTIKRATCIPEPVKIVPPDLSILNPVARRSTPVEKPTVKSKPVKRKSPTIPPDTPGAPKTDSKKSDHKKNPSAKEDGGKGCGCLLAVVMLLGGVALIANDCSKTGWTLAIVGGLAILGMLQEEK